MGMGGGFNMGGFGGGMGMDNFGNGRMSMDGMGVSGMSDYTSDFDKFSNPAGNMPGGSRMSDLTQAEREFLEGGGGGGGGENMMGGFGRGGARAGGRGGNRGPIPLFPDAAMQGRKIKVGGLTPELTDEMVCRYFRKFGVVDDWKKDKSGDFGYLEFTESYMVEYCLKRPTHLLDGNELQVTKAEPQFDETETQEAETEA